MIILGIETSCDETAAAVLTDKNNRITILSNIVASSADLQAKYGGVIPEQAAREQIKSIIPVIEEALNQAFPDVAPTSSVIPTKVGIHTNNSDSELAPRLRGDDRIKKIDSIAVTYGPGLIGSLLVGVETAKVLSSVWKKPLIPMNHLLGHFYANWITPPVIQRSATADRRNLNSVKIATLRQTQGKLARNDNFNIPTFPCIGLLISGGHTDLILFKGHSKYKYLGGTRDDAAGECFDKCARLLNLPYPGGPAISKLAEGGNPKAFDLPRPMINSKDFDFSFSGLKTAVSNLIQTNPVVLSEAKNLSRMRDSNKLRDPSSKTPQDDNKLANLAASIEQAIIDVLIYKTIKAVQTYNIDQIIVAGGVAANQKLKEALTLKIKDLGVNARLYIPSPTLCTDNAAMIAAAAFFNNHPINPNKLQANPNLSLSF